MLKTYTCGDGCGTALEKIEMDSMEQFLESGKVWFSRDKTKYSGEEITKISYKCLVGK